MATEHDWTTEYLDSKLSCRIVDGVEDAVSHINGYGSHHTDCIIAQDAKNVAYFHKKWTFFSVKEGITLIYLNLEIITLNLAKIRINS